MTKPLRRAGVARLVELEISPASPRRRRKTRRSRGIGLRVLPEVLRNSPSSSSPPTCRCCRRCTVKSAVKSPPSSTCAARFPANPEHRAVCVTCRPRPLFKRRERLLAGAVFEHLTEPDVGRVDEHREYRALEDVARRRREVEFRTEVAVCGKTSENGRRKNTNTLSADRSRERAFGVCRTPSGRSSLIASLGRGFPSFSARRACGRASQRPPSCRRLRAIDAFRRVPDRCASAWRRARTRPRA